MSTTKYSISASHRITGKSRTTISKHLQEGKLTCEVDEHGNKLIDASELLRVYGDACRFEREEGREANASPPRLSSVSSFSGAAAEARLEALEQQLSREMAERERERRQYREQVEHLQESLAKAQEGHNRATLLLEHQTKGGGDWERAVKLLEARLDQQEARSQQELQALRQAAKKRIANYRQALDQERQRSFWKRLWS